jgi:uncharacterized protein with FMN-binding domain
MKRQILFCVGVCFAISASAQSIKNRDVPQTVKTALKQMYPSASKMEWEMEDGMYEAEFVDQGQEISVYLTQEGKLAMTEVEIDPTGLPEGVLDYLKKEHVNVESLDVDRITNSLQVVTYEVEVGEITYLFSDQGQLLTRKTEADSKANDQ